MNFKGFLSGIFILDHKEEVFCVPPPPNCEIVWIWKENLLHLCEYHLVEHGSAAPAVLLRISFVRYKN